MANYLKMSFCIAKTKKGIQCSKKPLLNGYCSIHCEKEQKNHEPEKIECPICYCELTTENTVSLHCNHSFCKTCLIKSNKSKCALCRDVFNDDEKNNYILNFKASKKAMSELASIFKSLENNLDFTDDVKIANVSCKLAKIFKGVSLISLFGELENSSVLSKVCDYEETINSNEFKTICKNL